MCIPVLIPMVMLLGIPTEGCRATPRPLGVHGEILLSVEGVELDSTASFERIRHELEAARLAGRPPRFVVVRDGVVVELPDPNTIR